MGHFATLEADRRSSLCRLRPGSASGCAASRRNRRHLRGGAELQFLDLDLLLLLLGGVPPSSACSNRNLPKSMMRQTGGSGVGLDLDQVELRRPRAIRRASSRDKHPDHVRRHAPITRTLRDADLEVASGSAFSAVAAIRASSSKAISIVLDQRHLCRRSGLRALYRRSMNSVTKLMVPRSSPGSSAHRDLPRSPSRDRRPRPGTGLFCSVRSRILYPIFSFLKSASTRKP